MPLDPPMIYKPVPGQGSAAGVATIASTAELLAGSTAILDDGVNPPRLLRRRSDGTVLNLSSLFRGPFAPNTMYYAGDQVTYQAQVYGAKVGFTSAAAFSPSDWTLSVAKGADGTGFNVRGPWSPNTTYSLNDLVSYQGNMYGALAAFTSTAAFNAANWQLLVQAGSNGKSLVLRGLWSANTAYNVDELVSNGANLYRVKTAFTSGNSFDATNLELQVAQGPVSTTPGPIGPAPTIVSFAQGAAVVVGNLTNYNGGLYPVLTAHTYGAAFDPTKHGAGVALPGAAGKSLSNRGAWAANTTYAQGDLVSYQGSLYSALAAFTSGASFVPANWTLSVSGSSTLPALLVPATTYPKGNVYYQYGNTWNLLRPGSHELGQQNVAAMVDTFGNLIQDRSLVDVTGLGFALGVTYYVEEPDANGKNVQPIVLVNGAAPASLLPTVGRALFTLGQCKMLNGRMYLDFRLEANLAPGASWLNVFDITTLTLGATPTAQQVRRVLDVSGYGGASTNVLHADSDSGLSSGWTVSPPTQSGKQVFLLDTEFSQDKPHVATPAAWVPTQAGDYLFVYASGGGNGSAAGVAFAASATELYTLRLYGDNYVAGQHYTVASDNNSVSGPDFFQGHGVPTYAPKSIIFQRVRIDGTSFKTRFWGYGAAAHTPAGLLAALAAEPATWDVDLTNGMAFPVGEVGYLFNNSEYRLYAAAKSYDPQLPATLKAS